jgi:hypothetical protein
VLCQTADVDGVASSKLHDRVVDAPGVWLTYHVRPGYLSDAGGACDAYRRMAPRASWAGLWGCPVPEGVHR